MIKTKAKKPLKKSFKSLMKELLRKKTQARKAEMALRRFLNGLY